MAENDALLKDVLANPDDDGPRQAYAARLDAVGDPRGQFIGVQLRLARFDQSPDAPTRTLHVLDSQSYLDRFGAEWAAQIAPLAAAYEFHRGFVERVTMTGREFMDRAPLLFSLAPIQHLDLKEVAGISRELFQTPFLERIYSLDLNQCALSDDDVSELAASPHLGQLRWLSLAFNRITLAGAEALAASGQLPKLQYVNWTGNPVDPGEQYAQDQGIIVDRWLPRAGQDLEARYGNLPWLHLKARTTKEVPPTRFL